MDTSTTLSDTEETSKSAAAAACLNDNSNPQQGSPGRGPRSMVSAPTRATSTSINASLCNGERNERAPLKIPPTVKDARKLFVGGLPSTVTREEFRTFFEGFGEVVDSVVMYDHMTNRSRGFGFVTFQDPAVSAHLLHKSRLKMKGKWVEVKSAQPKQPTAAAAEIGNSRESYSNEGGNDCNSFDTTRNTTMQEHAIDPKSVLYGVYPAVFPINPPLDHGMMYYPNTMMPMMPVPPPLPMLGLEPPPVEPHQYGCFTPLRPHPYAFPNHGIHPLEPPPQCYPPDSMPYQQQFYPPQADIQQELRIHESSESNDYYATNNGQNYQCDNHQHDAPIAGNIPNNTASHGDESRTRQHGNEHAA